MTQSNQQHLTTGQISAYLDQRILTEEDKAHLSTCERCQEDTKTLQETVTLLQALPQPAVPRSFALPLSTGQTVSAQPLHVRSLRRKAPATKTLLRSASLLVAALGAIYLLLGLLSWTTSSYTTSSGAAPVMPASSIASSASNTDRARAESTIPITTPLPHPTPGTPKNGTQAIMAETPAPNPTATVPATTSGSVNNKTTHPDQTIPSAPSPLSFLDISTTGGKLAFGIVLLIIGSIGTVLLKQRKKDTQT